jgi:pimeloyl-ACP methyl ester carboxylesterase
MIVKVITFPIGKLAGRAARLVARDWDTERHPPRVRAYTPDGSLSDLTEEGWSHLSEGPVLLFVHGTFSTTEGGFGRLPAATRRMLHDRYAGRVIAYDHPTIADDPFANARRFFEIVGDRKLDLDIVCHSRGGLVSRSIAERPDTLAGLGRNVTVRQIVLVGALSKGTILADTEHWGELVDRVTTLIRLVPAPGAVDTLETVLTVVKSLAVGVAQELEGLDAMAPGSDYLKKLNKGGKQPGDPSYRVIGSDFEPRAPGLKAWLNDEVRDGLFDQLPNDMMVTIESMRGANGSGRFPIAPADCRLFAAPDAIEHSDYFGQPRTSEWLLAWLTGTS